MSECVMLIAAAVIAYCVMAYYFSWPYIILSATLHHLSFPED